MANPGLPKTESSRTIKAVNEALKRGYPPPHEAYGGEGAVSVAAKALGVTRPTLDNRLRSIKTKWKMEPDWALWRRPKPAPDAGGTVEEARAAAVEDDNKRLKRMVADLSGALRAAENEALTRRAVRDQIFGLKETESAPPDWVIRPPTGKNVLGVPTLFLSDWHVGEVVQPGQVAGQNAFDMAICRGRVRHTVQTAIDLLAGYMSRPQYPGIVVPLGGDMVSGNIHDELTATNEVPIMPAVLAAFEMLAWSIRTLAEKFGQVFVPCVTGNHGRTTKKIPAKDRASSNFDWLIYCLLARAFEANQNIRFLIPDGPDCYWRVYGHRYALTHGDQFRGGDGLIGPLGPITRGRHKKASRDSSMRQQWDTMMVGHFHTLMQLPHLIVNGSLKGYCEYAFRENYTWERPAQALWITHPQQGITFQMPVYCEAPARAVEKEGWVSWQAAA